MFYRELSEVCESMRTANMQKMTMLVRVWCVSMLTFGN